MILNGWDGGDSLCRKQKLTKAWKFPPDFTEVGPLLGYSWLSGTGRSGRTPMRVLNGFEQNRYTCSTICYQIKTGSNRMMNLGLEHDVVRDVVPDTDMLEFIFTLLTCL